MISLDVQLWRCIGVGGLPLLLAFARARASASRSSDGIQTQSDGLSCSGFRDDLAAVTSAEILRAVQQPGDVLAE